jgi:outer membrane protein assembly factor BamD (BamD/ComL family)
MIDRRLLIPAGVLTCAVLLAACGSAKYEWSQANSLNTVAAYQAFLAKYPNDVHAADAKTRIADLQDTQAWDTAQAASSTEGYQRYLTAEPSGSHAQAARDEIAAQERAAAWRTAQTNETAQSLQDFLQKYPTGAEADAARDKLKTLAGYRVELGSARSKRIADRERDTLAKRFDKDFPQVVVLEPDASNHDYRITSAPMSKEDASAACATVKKSGRSCEVIQVAG